MAPSGRLAIEDLPSGAPASVVIVDDEADLRLLIRLGLQGRDDFRVVGEGADGNEAIALAELHQPDVVLLDLNMPELDGREAIVPILVRSPRSMVVVLSALRAEVEAERLFDKGVFAFIEKGALGGSLADDLAALLDEFRRALRGETVVAGHPAVRLAPEARRLEGGQG